jgi:hypothetical protein
MFKVSVTIDPNQFTGTLKKVNQAIAALPPRGLVEFRALTPYYKGNARRSTRLQNTNREIIADYPYAQRLDNNWSRQTKGQGIVKPFAKWWTAQLRLIARIK